MDLNKLPENPVSQSIVPLEWTWISQRQKSEADSTSVWKFGFVAPDGGSVRVTFHQVGDNSELMQKKAAEQEQQAQAQMQMGMPPMPPPQKFVAPGTPNPDQTDSATFYVTFLSNRHPESFMRWDASLSHEDSLTTWVTITHGVIDFVRKAKPANVILDDLANGKLKMVLRSVAMDAVVSNPEYEIEQTQRHHYRSFFQIKRKGSQSAFSDTVQGSKVEGDTETPAPPSPATAPLPASTNELDKVDNDKTQDPTQPQPDTQPAFPSAQPVPIKQTPTAQKGLTVEIGKDYSIAVKNKEGNAIDRYRAKGPADILRWINEKGYASNKMVIVDNEQPSNTQAPEKVVKSLAIEQYEIVGNTIKVNSLISARRAGVMNQEIGAVKVLCKEGAVEFQFETDKDMVFKQTLVELAFTRTRTL